MAEVIGTIGDELDLLIKQGSVFGPMIVDLVNPDNSPVDLTGCTIRANMRWKDHTATPAIAFDISYIDRVNGQFSFGLTATVTEDLKAGKTVDSTDSRYLWDLELVDSTGRPIPYFYGVARVFRDI
jgi:hypothetical protein